MLKGGTTTWQRADEKEEIHTDSWEEHTVLGVTWLLWGRAQAWREKHRSELKPCFKLQELGQVTEPL